MGTLLKIVQDLKCISCKNWSFKRAYSDVCLETDAQVPKLMVIDLLVIILVPISSFSKNVCERFSSINQQWKFCISPHTSLFLHIKLRQHHFAGMTGNLARSPPNGSFSPGMCVRALTYPMQLRMFLHHRGTTPWHRQQLHFTKLALMWKPRLVFCPRLLLSLPVLSHLIALWSTHNSHVSSPETPVKNRRHPKHWRLSKG